jgi:hypothetical protein
VEHEVGEPEEERAENKEGNEGQDSPIVTPEAEEQTGTKGADFPYTEVV